MMLGAFWCLGGDLVAAAAWRPYGNLAFLDESSSPVPASSGSKEGLKSPVLGNASHGIHQHHQTLGISLLFCWAFAHGSQLLRIISVLQPHSNGKVTHHYKINEYLRALQEENQLKTPSNSLIMEAVPGAMWEVAANSP